MPPIFITGATGFVGRRVLRTLVGERSGSATCLVRGEVAIPELSDGSVEAIQGDLTAPGDWCGAVPEGGVVLHLAATTGSASAEEHHRVNTEGTRRLVDCARTVGVSRFVYVSSIAVTFEDAPYYHYAESKREAETVVEESGLDYAIVRPTMVFGPGSPVQEGLERLASAPVGLVFGSGDVRVQPVHVDDLARMLLDLCERPSGQMGSAVVEIGGRDTLKLLDLLRRLRRASRGSEGPFISLPLGPIRSLLGLLDRSMGRHLPLTAGQLATFANDGTAEEHAFTERRRERLAGIDEMVPGR